MSKNEHPEEFLTVVPTANMPAIRENGLNEGTYFVSSHFHDYEKLIDYYAEVVNEESPAGYVILSVKGEFLSDEHMEPDRPGIAEPITGAIGKTDNEVIDSWLRVDGEGTGRDTLNIIGSMQYSKRIPVEHITIESGQEPKPLMDYHSPKPLQSFTHTQ